MFGMNNFSSMGMFGSNNLLGSLFSGTNSIFNTGFNFFGNNMLGGGCSLFTNCNGTTNYDAMAGFGVANVVLNGTLMAISKSKSENKENSREAIQEKIDNLNGQILEKLAELGGLTEAEFKNKLKTDFTPLNDEHKLSKDVKTAQERMDQCSEAIDNASPSSTDWTTANNNYNTAKTAYEKAVAAKEAEEARLSKLYDEVQELIRQRDEQQEALEAAVCNKADGMSWFRDKDFEADENFFNEDNPEFDSGDIRQLVHQFSRSVDDFEKYRYAKAFEHLDNTRFNNIATDSQVAVRRMALEFCRKYEEENPNAKDHMFETDAGE